MVGRKIIWNKVPIKDKYKLENILLDQNPLNTYLITQSNWKICEPRQ